MREVWKCTIAGTGVHATPQAQIDRCYVRYAADQPIDLLQAAENVRVGGSNARRVGWIRPRLALRHHRGLMEDLDGDQRGILGDAVIGYRVRAGETVASGDAGHVRPVVATGDRAVDAGARGSRRGGAVGAEGGVAKARIGDRIARLGDDLAAQELMRFHHARVEDGDGLALPGVVARAEGTDWATADMGDADIQVGRVLLIFLDGGDVGIGGEGRQGRGVNGESEPRDELEARDGAELVADKPLEDSVLGALDALTLAACRLGNGE